MVLFPVLRTGLLIAALCLCAQGQNPPGKAEPLNESKGLPPRVTPEEYQSRVQVGAVTLAAEFAGHSVPTADGTYSSEDVVVVETALFGPSGARLRLSRGDFSLRINDGKKPLPTQPYELMARSLKDPQWIPPEPEKSKSQTGITSGGAAGGADSSPPAPVHMPFNLQLAMEQHVQKAIMLEGDRALPQAGLLFFEFRGKQKNIRSVELIYSGPAGKATLPLQP